MSDIIEDDDVQLDAEMQTLFVGVERRLQPSDEAIQAAFVQLKNEWQTQVRLRKRRRLQTFGAIAATVLIVFWATTMRVQTPQSWPLELTQGKLLKTDRQSENVPASGRFDIRPGTVVTSPAPARLVTDAGLELRMAPRTQLTWHEEHQFELVRGSVYVDTHDRGTLTVVTPLGTVTDLGTEFMVEQTEAGYDIGVRHGKITVESPHGQTVAVADAHSAQVVSLTDSGLDSHRETKAHQRWMWIHAASPGYTGGTVAEVLQAICADLGKRLHYASPGVEAAANTDTVQGELLHLSPQEALRAVAGSAELTWVESETELEVDFLR
jgi:hypothetical protein